jgi:serine/threonine protein kinase
MKAGKLGKGKDLWLSEPLDEFWIGSTARVFNGRLDGKNYAVKILRPETKVYDIQQFKTEVEILEKINNRPWITKIHQMGFLKLSHNLSFPPDPDYPKGSFDRFRSPFSADKLLGDIISYSLDEANTWLKKAQQKVDEGWLPYLVFRRRDCLPTPSRPDPKEVFLFQMLTVNNAYSKDKLVFIIKNLISVCQIYSDIHDLKIVYNDPKLAHYGWSKIDNCTFIIDWNFSKYMSSPKSESQNKIDLQKLGKHVLSPILDSFNNSNSIGQPFLDEFREICNKSHSGYYSSSDLLQKEIEALLGHLEGKY